MHAADSLVHLFVYPDSFFGCRLFSEASQVVRYSTIQDKTDSEKQSDITDETQYLSWNKTHVVETG